LERILSLPIHTEALENGCDRKMGGLAMMACCQPTTTIETVVGRLDPSTELKSYTLALD